MQSIADFPSCLLLVVQYSHNIVPEAKWKLMVTNYTSPAYQGPICCNGKMNGGTILTVLSAYYKTVTQDII